MQYLFNKDKIKEETFGKIEELTEAKLLDQYGSESYDAFLGKTTLSLGVSMILEDMGLPILFGIYCEAGKHFAADNFKDQMRKLEMGEMDILKLFNRLEYHRKIQANVPRQQPRSGISGSTTVSSSHIILY